MGPNEARRELARLARSNEITVDRLDDEADILAQQEAIKRYNNKKELKALGKLALRRSI